MIFSKRAGRIGRLSRVGTTLQIGFTVVLAIAAVLLVNWLAGRPQIRQRFDLTAAEKNTLSTATVGLLERTDDGLLIEFLYRRERSPRMQLDEEVMQRTRRLCQLIVAESGGKVAFQVVDVNDVDAWRARQAELRLQGFENGLLISRGERRVFKRLSGDLAQFQEGRNAQNGYIPPSIIAFTAEEAVVEGILDVTRGDELNAYFTSGSGEPVDLESEEPEGLGLVAELLASEGFKTHLWSVASDGDLPEDCDVLVVYGPQNAWPEAQYAQVVEYVEKGGRLLVAAPTDAAALRRSDVPDLLEHFDLEVSEGRVAGYVVNRQTGRPIDGVDECEIMVIPAAQLSTHPIVRPFRDSGMTVVMRSSHQVRVMAQPSEGVAQHLAMSPQACWIDAPPGDRRYTQGSDGSPSAFPLAATVQRPPIRELTEAPSGLDAIPEIRIVAFGSESMFQNREMRNASILPAAFNWVVDREHRITVPPRDPDLRYLPRDDPSALVTVTRFAQWFLPGFVGLLGLVVWVLRTRGSRRRAPSTRAGEARALHASTDPSPQDVAANTP